MSRFLFVRRLILPNLGLILLSFVVASLWLGGGASRADALGQSLVRAVSTLTLIALIFSGRRPNLIGMRPVAYFLAAILSLVLIQLIPLPPELWMSLPGRTPFAEAASLSGYPQPWRPIAIVPGGAVNAAASLIVPITVLMLIACLNADERRRLPGLLLLAIVASAVLGVIQLAGTGIDNPLINEDVGLASGMFANRNHSGLFIALGCMAAPVWAFMSAEQRRWRIPVALGSVLLFVIMAVVGGSRVGLLLAAFGLCAGAVLVQHEIRKAIGPNRRWVYLAGGGGIVLLFGLLIAASVMSDRAVSIDRFMNSDITHDMRQRSFPTLMNMIWAYFPVGSGFGGFDQMFRFHEPLALLKPTYFNHAHNDLVEVVLDGGLASLLLMVAAALWWLRASIGAWFASPGDAMLPRLGSAMLLFVAIASAFDYPARTPMMMAVIVIAAIWLAQRPKSRPGTALPTPGQPL
ncbi:O-antigen ligase family protein [Sphingomonas sp.]|uniref:O-antigen ligase family protein n=1 Tax=Sphingomonas sp. TaxID=28214 RepID=UPI001ED17A50|nr:O-antigen ligase family protein [Sphingomonas sp.]MBX3594747.1 O-antigen ligase family protein [Sphingomonas sp.]